MTATLYRIIFVTAQITGTLYLIIFVTTHLRGTASYCICECIDYSDVVSECLCVFQVTTMLYSAVSSYAEKKKLHSHALHIHTSYLPKLPREDEGAESNIHITSQLTSSLFVNTALSLYLGAFFLAF